MKSNFLRYGLMAASMLLTLGSAGATDKIVYDFLGGSLAASPSAQLWADADGNFYGTSNYGGTSDQGTIFRMKPPAAGKTDWTVSILHRFAGGADGTHPFDGLVRGPDGAFYGTTHNGGAYTAGTVFKLAPPTPGHPVWTETIIHDFKGGNDGAYPSSGVVTDAAGNLYGVSDFGGSGSNGTVFRLNAPKPGATTWTETILHAFTGGAGGGGPAAAVLRGPNGTLYGVTYWGGTGDNGTVFSLKPPSAGQTGWTKTILHTFAGGAAGSKPHGRLIMDATGVLYGTTEKGGTSGRGTVFKLAPPAAGKTAWTKSKLYDFKGGVDGGDPQYGSLLAINGNLYGTTWSGGSAGSGVAYRLKPPASGATWTETKLHSFLGGSDGAIPTGGLVPGPDGRLYGLTVSGGMAGRGVAYSVTP